MIFHRRLVPILLILLAARGMSPDDLQPWRKWVTFKHFARRVDEIPDPGISVPITPGRHGEVHLFFIRQSMTHTDEWSVPVGGAVCQLTFPRMSDLHAREFWSFDHSTFERFIEVVEGEPDFSALLLQAPKRTSVYWENA